MVLMSLETLIPFVIRHNAVIIQGLVALILLLVAILAVRNFLRTADAPAATAGMDMGELESTLKKLLERAGQVPAAAASGEAGALVAEIETLRASLAEKQDQIEQMKLAPAATPSEAGAPAAAATGAMSSDDKRLLEEQIRDLQAKLAEYEIISEDIADLSFYKEENAKLQKQLETLKTGAPAAAVSPASTAPADVAPVAPTTPVAADVDPAQAMVDSLMAMPTEELAKSAAPEPTPPSATETAPADAGGGRTSAADEDLLKEFADAVSAQAGGEPAPAQTPAPTAGEDAEAEAAAGLFDVERMTQEAGQLQKIADTVGEASPEATLEAGLDADRLAQEAASMETIKPEDAKLMGDFEDFMKKGGA